MQKNNQKSKAFTLVELIVVMAIVGVLVGLSVAGITIVQRNARDEERRSAISSIVLELEGYRGINGLYPITKTIIKSATSINYTNAIISVGTKDITLKGAATGNITIPTGTSTTDYCYTSTGSNYYIAAELEGGGVFSFGSGTVCNPGSSSTL